MGDRTTCTLKLIGVLCADHIPALAEALDDWGVEVSDNDEQSVAEALACGEGHFMVTDVNYAQLDKDIEALLQRCGLGWAWSWEAGGGFGPGIEFFDAIRQERGAFAAIEDEIVLPLSTIDRPGLVENARAWERFQESGRLLVYSSKHELLALQGAGTITGEQVERALGAAP